MVVFKTYKINSCHIQQRKFNYIVRKSMAEKLKIVENITSAITCDILFLYFYDLPVISFSFFPSVFSPIPIPRSYENGNFFLHVINFILQYVLLLSSYRSISGYTVMLHQHPLSITFTIPHPIATCPICFFVHRKIW